MKSFTTFECTTSGKIGKPIRNEKKIEVEGNKRGDESVERETFWFGRIVFAKGANRWHRKCHRKESTRISVVRSIKHDKNDYI